MKVSKDNGCRLEISLAYLSWHLIAGAVLDVFRENQRREKEPGCYKASADLWVSNSKLRRRIHEMACEFWCVRSGLDKTYFPFSEDYVARLYFRFRKRNHEEIISFEREIESSSALKHGQCKGVSEED